MSRSPSPPPRGGGSSGKRKGTVKWFNATKGFGFITPDDGSEDVFVHQTSLYAKGFRTLAEGEEVEYDLADDGGRIKASNVTGPHGAPVKGGPPSSGGGGGGGGRGGYGDRGYGGGGDRYGGDRRGGGGGGGDRSCYNCGEPGHISRDCDRPRAERGGGGGGGGGRSNRDSYDRSHSSGSGGSRGYAPY